MKKLVLGLTLALALSGCGTQNDLPPADEPTDTSTGVELNVDTSTWTLLQGDGFTVKAPNSWALTPEQGIDSYVGSIYGNGMSINFDFGALSEDEFASDSATYIASQEEVDGKEALLYVPRSTVEGKMGAFITASDTEKLSMTTEAKSMDERLLLLEVMRSVEFSQ